jgi:hemerythrin superfamily protein
MATTTQARDSKGQFKQERGKTGGFGAIAGAVVGGAALGVLAMLGRKAAVQSATVLAGDWVDGLIAEHRAVLKLFDAIEATENGAAGRRTLLLAQIKHALAKHALEEENVIYPALREAGRIAEADELTREHGYVKQHLYDLENMSNATPAFLEKVRRFRADLEDHMREEEAELFPALRGQSTDEKNKMLTVAMNKEGFKLA